MHGGAAGIGAPVDNKRFAVEHQHNLAAILAWEITPVTEDRMAGPVLGDRSFGRQR
jgi:hypothetical protein